MNGEQWAKENRKEHTPRTIAEIVAFDAGVLAGRRQAEAQRLTVDDLIDVMQDWVLIRKAQNMDSDGFARSLAECIHAAIYKGEV